MNTDRNPVGWFELYVQDMERARKFYETTLGVKLERLDTPDLEMWMFPGEPDRPGCTGALCRMPGKDSGGGGTIIYFSCADCAVEAGHVAENGGEVFKEKMLIGEYGFIALVTDPDGNMIGLHSML